MNLHLISSNRKYLILIALLILVPVLLYAVIKPSSAQEPVFTGSGPITTQERAIQVAQFVAANNRSSTDDKALQFSLASVTSMNLAELKDTLSSSGTTISDLNSLATDAQGPYWRVLFTGSFSPKHVPAGITPPVYSTIEIFLDAKDGGVLHLKMHN